MKFDTTWIQCRFLHRLSGATENLARNKKRQKYFGYSLERNLARDKVIFVIAETIAFPVGVVAVHQKFIFSQACVQVSQTFCDKSVSGSFIGHNFTRVTAFGCGIFRVGAVYVQTPGVRENFIELAIVIGSRSFGFAFDLKASGIQEGIFIFVIPQSIGSRKSRAMTD